MVTSIVMDTTLRMFFTVMTDIIAIETEQEVVDCLTTCTTCLAMQAIMVSVIQDTTTEIICKATIKAMIEG